MTTLLTVLLLAAHAHAKPPPERDSFLEEALFAGGARDQLELDRLVALYHERIDPMVEVVRDQPKAIATQLLLKHLHLSYGGTTAVLKEYQSGAWSVNRALDTGFYNCLSASMLFILAARQAGLDVTGEIYSDHATALVRIGGRDYHVEATSKYGFNVDNWHLATRVNLETGALTVVAVSRLGIGTEPLMRANWAWAGQPRDARWASHVTVSPPPLITAFTGPLEAH